MFGKMTGTACIGIVLVLATTLPVWANPLSLTVEENLLTLQARKASLRSILQEITRQTGIEIATEGNLEVPISANLSRIPLEEGIKRITPDFNTFIYYDNTKTPHKGAMKLQKIVLYSKNSSPSAGGGLAPLRPQEDPLEALVIRADTIPELDLLLTSVPEHDILAELAVHQQDEQSLEELLGSSDIPSLDLLDLEAQEAPSLEEILDSSNNQQELLPAD
jgi:hypothetical protein